MLANISICLSDIPKESITTSEKNGKKYASIVVADRRSPDKQGNDITVYMNQTKEQREAKEEKIYIGSGKAVHFNNSQTSQNAPTFQQKAETSKQQLDFNKPDEFSDLPF